MMVLRQRLAQLESVSEQIEQAKMFEYGWESENDNTNDITKSAVAGTHAFVVSKLLAFKFLSFLDILQQPRLIGAHPSDSDLISAETYMSH